MDIHWYSVEIAKRKPPLLVLLGSAYDPASDRSWSEGWLVGPDKTPNWSAERYSRWCHGDNTIILDIMAKEHFLAKALSLRDAEPACVSEEDVAFRSFNDWYRFRAWRAADLYQDIDWIANYATSPAFKTSIAEPAIPAVNVGPLVGLSDLH